MRIIVCGSGTYEDYPFLEKTCLDIIKKLQYNYPIATKDIEIVVIDNPRGASYHAKKFAKTYKFSLKLFSVDWNDLTPPVMLGTNYYGSYNKLAGSNSATKVVDYVWEDERAFCIAFDMETKEVKDIIRKCKKQGIITYQIKCLDMGNMKIKIWNDETEKVEQ